MEAAVSLTCDDTTSACPGTELTCTCSVDTNGILWRLPRGGGDIVFARDSGVGVTKTGGIFHAKITDISPKRIVSLLKYNATQILVNTVILCNDGSRYAINTSTITGFASKYNFMCLCTCMCTSILTYMYIIVCLSIDPPSVPNNVSVQSTTYNSATIQWTEPSDNGGSAITGYNITISPSTSTCSSCVVSSDTLMYNITELDHTINYTVSVAAINCAGTGDSVFLDIIAKGTFVW